MLALLLLAMLVGACGASAQTPVESQTRSIFDELRLGALLHNAEPGGTERGTDVNFELLFSRPAVAYSSHFADMAFRPRFHVGASVNVDGYTSQGYAGLTWEIVLHERLLLEVTFGGSVHDGPSNVAGTSFGCPLNFRESASVGIAVTERWRLYGTIAHMSNAGLCDRNSGLTSAGARLGYALN